MSPVLLPPASSVIVPLTPPPPLQDLLRVALHDEAGVLAQGGLGNGIRDRLEWGCDHLGRVADGHAAPRAAVIERKHSHCASVASIASRAVSSASSSRSGSLP